MSKKIENWNNWPKKHAPNTMKIINSLKIQQDCSQHRKSVDVGIELYIRNGRRGNKIDETKEEE